MHQIFIEYKRLLWNNCLETLTGLEIIFPKSQSSVCLHKRIDSNNYSSVIKESIVKARMKLTNIMQK